jgi:hypothetical protein
VNQQRNDGKKYSDEVAAKAVNGNPNKTALTSNPFASEFEYGVVVGHGYWDHNHMVLQMEDCLDVLRVLHMAWTCMITCFYSTTRQDMTSSDQMVYL